jgi:hypothetical protein
MEQIAVAVAVAVNDNVNDDAVRLSSADASTA